jgi:hypothetical protein
VLCVVGCETLVMLSSLVYLCIMKLLSYVAIVSAFHPGTVGR